MAGKKQAAKPVDDDSEEAEGEGWENPVDVDADGQDEAGHRMRDWRDVEKYREMRELRRLVGDDFDFTDVLGEVPIRSAQASRADAKGKAAKLAVVPRPAPPAPAGKAKPAAKPPHPPAPPAKPVKKAAPAKDVKPAPKPAAKHPPKKAAKPKRQHAKKK